MRVYDTIRDPSGRVGLPRWPLLEYSGNVRTDGMGKKPTVTIIGAGYVGFPLACAVAGTGKYRTFVYTIDGAAVAAINGGRSPLAEYPFPDCSIAATTDPAACLPQSDIVVICVPTSVSRQGIPDLTALTAAVRVVGGHLKRGQLIIVESTVPPATCERVVAPILSESGLVPGRDFQLSHCPERVNPADPHWNVTNIPRNAGSLTRRGLGQTVAFYAGFVKAPVNPMPTIIEAECTKLVENAFRDLNIAFANELAMMFGEMGVDAVRVIDGAASKPFGFLAHYPGCGVGGDCIGISPYFLAAGRKNALKLSERARKTNESMPAYTVSLLASAVANMPVSVGVLGLTYKKNVRDIRRSPGIAIARLAKRLGPVNTYDPMRPDLSTSKDLSAILSVSPAVIVTVDHPEFVKNLTGRRLSRFGVRYVIDGRNCLDAGDIRRHGISYTGIGR
jgi:UDP-N-acetyl-D-glucosamine dehydrogenase